MIPYTKYGAEVFIPMLHFSRMMYTVGLRCNHDIAQHAEIGFDVAVIKAGIPDSEQIPAGERCNSDIRSKT